MIDVAVVVTFVPPALLFAIKDPRSGPRWWRILCLVTFIAAGSACLAHFLLGFEIRAPISPAFGRTLEMLTSATMLFACGIGIWRRAREASTQQLAANA